MILKFDQDIFHTKHLCEVTAKSSINEDARAMTMFFSRNSYGDLDLGPRIVYLPVFLFCLRPRGHFWQVTARRAVKKREKIKERQ